MYVNYRPTSCIGLVLNVTHYLLRCMSSSSNSLYQLNSKITSCFKRGEIEAARHLFNEMLHKNVVTWNCMISGYVKNNKIHEAREVFDSMPSRDIVSWTSMVSGYAKFGRLDVARSLFDAIPDKNVVCWNSMISGYLSNGRIDEARRLFDAMPVKNSVSWAVLIEGYFHHGFVREAENLFDQAPIKAVSLYNTMLAGYIDIGYLEDSWRLFTRMPRRDVASWTSMITCFSRAGQVDRARGLFDEMPEKDVVAWTVMIRGYLYNSQIEEARKLFNQIPDRDNIAWNSMIGGYVQMGRFEDALELFIKMPRRDIVSWNLMLKAYVQTDDMINACNFFHQMPKKDETSWNTIISGHRSDEALTLFYQMLQNGFKPDQGTLTSIISLCGVLAIHGWGRAIHSCVIKSGYENDTVVISSLISMYSKCGFMNDSVLVFEKMMNKDTIAWNTMIVAQAYHGSASEALELFPSMVRAGFEPDHVTFLGLLTTCAHSGLVDEGWKYFNSMERDWNLIPKPEHFASMVDLLGRSGLVVEAYELVKNLPVELPAYTWETLLSSCKVHQKYELGELVAEKFLSVQPSNVGMYVLMSNIYASRGMWDDAENIRGLLNRHRLKKELACSWIEKSGQISQFVYNDKSHRQTTDIYRELESLSIIIEEQA